MLWAGNKPVHIGYYERQEDAARAYDLEAIKLRGPNTLLNFSAASYGARCTLLLVLLAAHMVLGSSLPSRQCSIRITDSKNCVKSAPHWY